MLASPGLAMPPAGDGDFGVWQLWTNADSGAASIGGAGLSQHAVMNDQFTAQQEVSASAGVGNSSAHVTVAAIVLFALAGLWLFHEGGFRGLVDVSVTRGR